MKKAILTFGLFSLMLVLTSFTNPSDIGGQTYPPTVPFQNEIGGQTYPPTVPFQNEIGGQTYPTPGL